jgi:hypothetical protein
VRHGRANFQQALQFLVDLFLQGDVDRTVVESIRRRVSAIGSPSDGDSGWFRRMAHAVATLPEAQLA